MKKQPIIYLGGGLKRKIPIKQIIADPDDGIDAHMVKDMAGEFANFLYDNTTWVYEEALLKELRRLNK